MKWGISHARAANEKFLISSDDRGKVENVPIL